MKARGVIAKSGSPVEGAQVIGTWLKEEGYDSILDGMMTHLYTAWHLEARGVIAKNDSPVEGAQIVGILKRPQEFAQTQGVGPCACAWFMSIIWMSHGATCDICGSKV